MNSSNHIKHGVSCFYTDLEWAIGINRLILQLVGLWRANLNYNTIMISNIHFALTVCMVLLFYLLPGIFAFQVVWGDLTLMIDNLNYTLPICGTVTKLLSLWSHREVLAVMNDTMIADWLKPRTDKELNTMRKWAQISRMICIANFTFTLGVITMYAILPWLGFPMRKAADINGIDERLPIPAYYFYDLSKTSHFVFAYFMQLTSMFAIGISISGVDSYLALLIFHVCGQLENLNERLANLNSFKYFRYGISTCVQEHIRLLRSIESIDNSFTLMLLIDVIFLTITFCLHASTMLIEIDAENMSVGRIFTILCAMVLTLGHFCAFCVVGEILANQLLKTSGGYISVLLANQN